jgi:hypothetical protein
VFTLYYIETNWADGFTSFIWKKNMLDISHILNGWNYNPDEINVRIIQGDDHTPKIQMRLDLGLLQMEYDGRPDGKTPFGYESYFEYYKHELQEYRIQNGSDDEFILDYDACDILQNEAVQYYYRYLSLFHLKEFNAVVRDTNRNLSVFDFIKQYALREEDRNMLEQYRPYVIMMNTRARAQLCLKDNQEKLSNVVDEKSRAHPRIYC